MECNLGTIKDLTSGLDTKELQDFCHFQEMVLHFSYVRMNA